jgi:hypothetical protein
MALVEYGRTRCPVRRRTIDRPGEYVAFPHFIEDPNDPLWPYSDSAIHSWCFATWPLREEFSKRLDLSMRRAT